MLFVIEILAEPDGGGNERVIERRAHTGPSVTEALRTAQANLRAPPPSAYSFSMRADGREVGRWRRHHDDTADVLHDIETVNLNFPAEHDTELD